MGQGAGTAAWKVAPGAGFVVADPEGLVGLQQVTKVDFRVTTGFEFKDEQVRQRLIDAIVRNRKLGKTTAEAERMVDTACTFTGPLESDALSDRFFREMMRCAGVRFLKRWIMWAAVALRTRWAAGGVRQAAVVVWGVLAAAGISAFSWSIGAFFG